MGKTIPMHQFRQHDRSANSDSEEIGNEKKIWGANKTARSIRKEIQLFGRPCSQFRKIRINLWEKSSAYWMVLLPLNMTQIKSFGNVRHELELASYRHRLREKEQIKRLFAHKLIRSNMKLKFILSKEKHTSSNVSYWGRTGLRLQFIMIAKLKCYAIVSQRGADH